MYSQGIAKVRIHPDENMNVLNVMEIHPITKDFNLMVVLESKSGHHQGQYVSNLSSNHEYVFFLWIHTDRQTD